MIEYSAKELKEIAHKKSKLKRKITEIQILDLKMGEYSSGYIVALCNDGTLWKHNDKAKGSLESEEWIKLKDIPQPGDDE